MAIGSEWGRKVEISYGASYVPSSQTNFPLVITDVSVPSEMLDADGLYPAKSDGSDIRFSSDEGGLTELAFDLRGITIDNNPANGSFEAVVKIPSISSSGGSIWMWYNNPSATGYAASDTYGKYNAYNSGYRLVIPFVEDPGSSDPYDRTSYQNNGTYGSDFDSSDWVDDGIKKAISMQTIAYHTILFSDHSSLDITGQLSISCYIKPTTASKFNDPIIAKWGGVPSLSSYALMWSYVGSNKLMMIVNDGGNKYAQSASTYNAANPLWITGEMDGSNVRLYINGSENVTGDAASSIYSSSYDLCFGNYHNDPICSWDGNNDEVRIAAEAHGFDWHTIEKNNILSESSMLSVGTPVTTDVMKSSIIVIN